MTDTNRDQKSGQADPGRRDDKESGQPVQLDPETEKQRPEHGKPGQVPGQSQRPGQGPSHGGQQPGGQPHQGEKEHDGDQHAGKQRQ